MSDPKPLKGQPQLEHNLVKAQAYVQTIIKDQEKVLEIAAERIKALNKDLRALRFRLKPFQKGKEPNFTYYRLKEEYEDKLQRRAVYQRAINMAEESISAARLNTVPGQEYAKGERL